MGKSHGAHHRDLKKTDVIKAFKALGIGFTETHNKKRILLVEQLPPGIKPAIVPALHYDGRDHIETQEVRNLARTLNLTMDQLGL